MAYRETKKIRAHKEQRGASILGAAGRLVSSGRPLSMESVAQGAGVSVGTVYSYFRTRRELLQELFDQRAAVELSVMGHALNASADPAAAVRGAAVLALRRARKNPGMTLFLLLERMDRDRDARMEAAKLAFHRRHARAIGDVVQRAMDAGQLPRRNAEVIGAAVLGTIIEISIRAVDATGDDPLSLLSTAALEAELSDTVLALCGFANHDLPQVKT